MTKASTRSAWRNRGVLAALGAALLFGAGTPAAKLLLGPVSPWLLAAMRLLQRAEPARLTLSERG